MFRKTRILGLSILVFVLSVIAYAQTTTNYGRLSVAWPDFGFPGGVALHTALTDGVEKISDNMGSRYFEVLNLANSASTSDLTHGFQTALASLNIVLYSLNEGTGELTRLTTATSPALSDFAIIAGTDATDQIKITNNSGSEQDIAVLVLQSIRYADASNSGTVSTTTQTFAGGKTIAGVADEVQLKVQGDALQTANVFEVEDDSAADLFKVALDGTTTIKGDATEDLIISSTNASANLDLVFDSNGTKAGISVDGGADSLAFKTSGTSRMTIASNGGTAVTGASAIELFTVGAFDTTTAVRAFQVTGPGTTLFGVDNPGKVGVFLTNWATSATQDVCATVTTGEGALSKCSSSARYKKEIQNITWDTSKIYDLVPREFVWKDSGQKDFGFIAEEVHSVLPQAAIPVIDEDGNHYYDEEGNLMIESVKYKHLVAPMIAEMKKLRKRMDVLEDENAKLNGLVRILSRNVK